MNNRLTMVDITPGAVIPTIIAPEGSNIFIGKSGEGKSALAQLIKYIRSDSLKEFKYANDESLHLLIGIYVSKDVRFFEVLFNTKFSDVKSGDEALENLGREVAKQLDKYSGKVSSAVFIEPDEYGTLCDVIIEPIPIGFSGSGNLKYVAEYDGKPYTVNNLLGVTLILGCLNPVVYSSAIAGLFELAGISDSTVKGGMSTGIVNAVQIVNGAATKLLSSLILEVRDDWQDSETNLIMKGAGRTYSIVRDVDIAQFRLRTLPRRFFTDAARFIFEVQAASPDVREHLRMIKEREIELGLIPSDGKDDFVFEGRPLNEQFNTQNYVRDYKDAGKWQND